VTVRAVFLWHLHQPEYRDPLTGKPVLPWVRLHATRAYTDMAAALEKHPSVQVVANFAPSLLLQLEAFASGASVDRDEEIARKPASALSTAERAHVIKESFSVDWDLWVRPVPRYAELLDKRGQDLGRVDLASKQGEFSDAEVVDLQVHFILAWMGFWARREEPLILRLLAKGRGFSHEEKVVLLDLSRAIAGRVVPRYRALAAPIMAEIARAMSQARRPVLVAVSGRSRAESAT